MQLITYRCVGCGYCVLTCPSAALINTGQAELLPANCTDCNLCVYACPADCFIPDKPIKPYRPHVKPAYDVVIIGSGLGGLLTGAALARAGRSVAVFEKLGFPGGRYTELDYNGAAVTTGAWTNLGPQSHIGRFLVDLGIQLDYISLEDVGLTEQYAIRFPDGRHYAGLFEMLAPATRKAWLKAVLSGRHKPSLNAISAADYIAQFTTDPALLAVIEAVVATASSLSSAQMSASEYIEIVLRGREAGRQFAMPRGGVRAIITALVQTLRQAGGQLFLRTPVAKMLITDRKVAGVELADGRTVHSDIVIHNAGPACFTKLAGPENLSPDYVNKLTTLKGAECAALFVATREPLFTNVPITMTPACRRVAGIFSPTVFDPGLSKTGLHLFDAFFPLRSSHRAAELALALADLRDLFPHFDEVTAWTMPMFFTGLWPGTESAQTLGQTGDQRLSPVTPLENCYLVGMDVQGSGVAGDLIPLGVRQLLGILGVRGTIESTH
jgi:phytoene dehydrogenase-like protein/NAD-dependent dihydropyrimidine dehydrogenase PreA subunit